MFLVSLWNSDAMVSAVVKRIATLHCSRACGLMKAFLPDRFFRPAWFVCEVFSFETLVPPYSTTMIICTCQASSPAMLEYSCTHFHDYFSNPTFVSMCFSPLYACLLSSFSNASTQKESHLKKHTRHCLLSCRSNCLACSHLVGHSCITCTKVAHVSSQRRYIFTVFTHHIRLHCQAHNSLPDSWIVMCSPIGSQIQWSNPLNMTSSVFKLNDQELFHHSATHSAYTQPHGKKAVMIL